MTVMARLTYPEPPTADQVDDYHGTRIADPYRPLEDSDAPASRAWIEAENRLTEGILGAFAARAEIRERLAALWDFPRAGAPWRRGDRWFQLRNTGLQDQDVLWTADAPDGEGTVLLDPNRLSAQGTTDAVGDRGQRERRARRVRDQRRRVGLAHVDRPPRRDRRTAARSPPVEQVHARRVDPRRRRLLLRPLPGTAGGRRVRRAEPGPRPVLSPDRDGGVRRRRRVRDARGARVAVRPRRSRTTARC